MQTSLLLDVCLYMQKRFSTNDFQSVVSRELNDMVHTHQKHLQSWDEDRQRVTELELLRFCLMPDDFTHQSEISNATQWDKT
jgi:hypothetical protein